MKPNILHIFPRFAGGGPEVRTTELINRTSDQFRHAVLSIHDDVSGQKRVQREVEFRCSAAEHSTIRSLRNAIKTHCPDAVFTYGWGGVDAIVASRLAGIRQIVHMEDGFLADEVSKQKPLRRLARRLVFQLAGSVVVPSRSLEETALREWKVPARRLLYVPNGVDGERFRRCASPEEQIAIREKLGIPAAKIVVGTVGGLRPEKNHLRLLRTFADVASKVERSHLIIVGDGPLAGQMESEARRRGILHCVTFCGVAPDPAEHYRAMDIFALSSDTEQMPLALLEAMATGLPVVSTAVGDVVGMAAEENRNQIVDVHDESAFAASLQLLLTDSKFRHKLGEANHLRFAKYYSLAHMVAAYRELYESATQDKS